MPKHQRPPQRKRPIHTFVDLDAMSQWVELMITHGVINEDKAPYVRQEIHGLCEGRPVSENGVTLLNGSLEVHNKRTGELFEAAQNMKWLLPDIDPENPSRISPAVEARAKRMAVEGRMPAAIKLIKEETGWGTEDALRHARKISQLAPTGRRPK